MKLKNIFYLMFSIVAGFVVGTSITLAAVKKSKISTIKQKIKQENLHKKYGAISCQIKKISKKPSEQHDDTALEKEFSNVPADYALYGVTTDKETKGWIYCGKKVAAFII